MKELKRCPFCGSIASEPHESDVYEDFVTCGDCDYHMETDIYNSRPIEDELREELEKAWAQNDQLIEACKAALQTMSESARMTYAYDAYLMISDAIAGKG